MSTESDQPASDVSAGESGAANAPLLNRTNYQILRSIAAFSSLPEPELIALTKFCYIRTYISAENIITEGDNTGQADGFIVLSGRLAMMKTSLSGRELVVELLPPGDLFGLFLALVPTSLPNALSARAQLNSVLLWVPIRSLAPVLKAYPAMYQGFFSCLMEHLQSSFRMSRGLAHDSVEVRIATILIRLAARFSRPPHNIYEQTIDITRYQLAELAGTTTESAIRTTRSMEKSGLIDIGRPSVIRVVNLTGLQLIADHQ